MNDKNPFNKNKKYIEIGDTYVYPGDSLFTIFELIVKAAKDGEKFYKDQLNRLNNNFREVGQ